LFDRLQLLSERFGSLYRQKNLAASVVETNHRPCLKPLRPVDRFAVNECFRKYAFVSIAISFTHWRAVMNRDIVGGNLKQLKGKIKQQWGKLTDDEIDEVAGSTEILAGKLQERYGWEREEAERQVKDFSSRHDWQ
jgi:uncharacterized protein YjbJ (UPF0337 family)